MQDPFLVFPTEIRIEILKELNLTSLYAATRAFLSLARTFNIYGSAITNASIQTYPRSIQRCIRAGITVSGLPPTRISLGAFATFHLYGHASDVPNAPLSPALAHRLLLKAWKLHWATQSCLQDLTSRIDRACRNWTKKKPDKPPSPFSWVEEHRVLRAYWRAQLSLDFRAAGMFAKWMIENPSLQIWAKLASFECKELATIMQYESHKQCLRENHSFPPGIEEQLLEHRERRSRSHDHDRFYVQVLSDRIKHRPATPLPPCRIQFSEIIFSEDMVQATWPTPAPGGDPLSFFAGQDENHLNFAASAGARIYHTADFWDEASIPGLQNQHTQVDPLKHLGASLWDKRRMYLLGIPDLKWENCLEYQLPSVDADAIGLPMIYDSMTMCERWQKVFHKGAQMMLGEAD